MPKKGTATNTHKARAMVVDRDPVGGSYHGNTPNKFDVKINKNNVAINGK
jgi:hypothetical protein